MTVVAIDHVQLAAPPGCEADARAFYGDLLGMEELLKPEPIRARGGCWFSAGGQELHIGVEDPFSPARKAHPGLAVSNLDAIRDRFRGVGVDFEDDTKIEGVDRLFVHDPFGNRLELRQAWPARQRAVPAGLEVTGHGFTIPSMRFASLAARLSGIGRASVSSGRSQVPWGRPRSEIALLGLIAVVALLPLPRPNPQDITRACLGQAMLHGRLTIDGCPSRDYAVWGGHRYSDKAPGLSVLELPELAVFNALPGGSGGATRLWVMRTLTVGLALLGCVFLVGRVSEGLAPGYGAITMVTFGLGTIAASLTQISFEHLPAALAIFGAFLLAWRRQPLAAGLAGGAGLLLAYENGLLLGVIGLYVAIAGGRGVVRFAAGVLPGAMLLGAYNWAAFGAPWHLSYRYVAPEFAAQQGHGFFGIGLPNLSGVFAVFAGNGGLLFISPVLALGAYGLVLLGRRFPAEAVVAGAITILMLAVDIGYYLPYGGTSPGPRFFVPALPFLALGLGEAFRRRPRQTLALASLSVFTTTAISLGWASGTIVMRNTVWGELVRLPSELGSSPFIKAISPTILESPGVAAKAAGVALMVAGAATAVVIAARTMPKAASFSRPFSLRNQLTVSLVVVVLAAVDASAILGFPYGNGYQPRHTPASVRASSSPASSYLGGEVNYTIQVTNVSEFVFLTDVVLTINLAPAMHLVGPPKVEVGRGCVSQTESVIRCALGYLDAGEVTNIWFGIQFSETGPHALLARVSSNGFDGPKATEYDVPVGR